LYKLGEPCNEFVVGTDPRSVTEKALDGRRLSFSPVGKALEGLRLLAADADGEVPIESVSLQTTSDDCVRPLRSIEWGGVMRTVSRGVS
jgi:hypothetical protein